MSQEQLPFPAPKTPSGRYVHCQGCWWKEGGCWNEALGERGAVLDDARVRTCIQTGARTNKNAVWLKALGGT